MLQNDHQTSLTNNKQKLLLKHSEIRWSNQKTPNRGCHKSTTSKNRKLLGKFRVWRKISLFSAGFFAASNASKKFEGFRTEAWQQNSFYPMKKITPRPATAEDDHAVFQYLDQSINDIPMQDGLGAKNPFLICFLFVLFERSFHSRTEITGIFARFLPIDHKALAAEPLPTKSSLSCLTVQTSISTYDFVSPVGCFQK